MVTASQTRAEEGKAERSHAPRSSHGDWEPAPGRRDTVDVLEEEARTRVPELVPIRYGRMAVSPFAFFRGGAGLMAADLAHTPVSGTRVQLCGDAHLLNFGGLASPERTLVFDLNDFDETLPGPWEWDVKRLAASIAIAGRERGLGVKRRDALVRGAIGEYRRAIRRFAGMPALAVWFSRLDEQSLTTALREEMGAEHARRLDGRAAKARSKDSNRAFAKLAYHINGDARIVSEPPLITPIEELVPAARAEEINEMMTELLARYRATLRTELRRLLDRYRFVHVARKVVGVGSVGTRAWVLLLLGREHSDPLFLQAKEAGPSALEAYVGPCELDNQGQRVVEGQVLTQAASDIFLGWLRAEGIDGQTRDFYVRQLWDWKVSADLEHMEPKVLGVYARLCGWTLARAHARAGDAAAIGGYLGSGDVFDRALAGFAELYADQNEHDYGLFVAAIRSGRIAAHHL